MLLMLYFLSYKLNYINRSLFNFNFYLGILISKNSTPSKQENRNPVCKQFFNEKMGKHIFRNDFLLLNWQSFPIRYQYQSLLQKKMQAQFVIPMISKDGKMINMEVKQKNQQVTKRRVKTWTNEEDNQLLELYQKFPKKWAEIAALMNDRNQNQCLHRYRRLSQLGKNHKIWSSEQDETIRKLIKKYGKNWKLLSEMLGSKNGKQIRERFINKLDPRIKKEDWSEEEDHKILELYSKIGSKWSQISKYLPGRPQNKIKNRFYSFIQKNFDIRFKQVLGMEENIENKPKMVIKQAKEITNLTQPFHNRSTNLIEIKEEYKMSEERIFSKFQIPSINEIEFDIKNEHISHNLLDSAVQVEFDWKQNLNNYHSIVELQSNDLFFKFQN